MKEIVSVKSNPAYVQKDSKQFELLPVLEIIIIYSDGKQYRVNKAGLEGQAKFSEARFVVTSEMLQALITDLQLHKKKMDAVRHNGEQINALIRHITDLEDVT